MNRFPRPRGFDHTIALLREGYEFIGNRCDELGADAFEARLMLRSVICMRGAEAAEIFYAGDRFTRRGAMPIATLTLLQDFGSVQLMDGARHRHRKQMFLSLADGKTAERLSQHMTREWTNRLAQGQASFVLFNEIRAVLTRAGLAWAGIPFTEEEAERHTTELSEMIEAAGSFGFRNLRTQVLRWRAEHWARRVIRAIRAGELQPPPDSASYVVAMFRDERGLLPEKVAAVELLNVLRPIVAVGRLIVFAALALHRHPEAHRRIAAGDEAYIQAFAEEVRRHSPFFPVIGGRVRRVFTWRGRRFAIGDWVLLDLYGTNRDARVWPNPDVFRPERFLEKTPTLYNFVPQGAGDATETHRCPGETLTVSLIKTAVSLLVQMDYDVPQQDFSIDLAKMPALPNSGFIMANARFTANERRGASDAVPLPTQGQTITAE